MNRYNLNPCYYNQGIPCTSSNERERLLIMERGLQNGRRGTNGSFNCTKEMGRGGCSHAERSFGKALIREGERFPSLQKYGIAC